VGACAIIAARVGGRPAWLHWAGLFLLNWLFAAYVIASLAI
jgi:hypothetical protein